MVVVREPLSVVVVREPVGEAVVGSPWAWRCCGGSRMSRRRRQGPGVRDGREGSSWRGHRAFGVTRFNMSEVEWKCPAEREEL